MKNRPETLQDYQERINRVLLYIRQHHAESMRLKDLAQVACFSPYHFHRLFTAHVGETLCEYVRRLRLETAAQRLCQTEDPITNIALDTGYGTHGAFTKAFTQHFQMSPSSFRATQEMKSIPGKLLIINHEHEEIVMEVEIREIEAQPALALRKTGDYCTAAGEAWGALCAYAGPKGLIGPGTRFIGISHDDPEVVDAEKLRYDACLTLTRDDPGDGEIKKIMVGGGRFAIALHSGPYEKMGETYRGIYKDWLPATGEKLREAACLEIYLNDPGSTAPEDLRTEICMPIE